MIPTYVVSKLFINNIKTVQKEKYIYNIKDGFYFKN
jgi:hypothetical protein